MNNNIKIFDDWALLNKDKAMAQGHKSSVNCMFDILYKSTNFDQYPFSFMDIGCGNGWVINKVLKINNCNYALGLDGSKNMIKKAIKLNIGEFIQTNMENYKFTKKFDFVFSMETFYYFSNPDKIIQNIFNNGLKDNGNIIVGIDHYIENKPSLSWENDYCLNLNTLSISNWSKIFSIVPFKNIQTYIVNKKKNWYGTLVIHAQK